MRAFLKGVGKQFYHQVNSTKINKFKTTAFADIQHRLLTTNNDIKTATKEFVTKSKKTEHFTRLDTYEKIPNLLLKATIFMCAITYVNVVVYSTTTFLHLCISWGLTPITKLIIKSGADLNILDKNQLTPLLYAIAKNKTEGAKLLIDGGADLNIGDEELHTPIHKAVITGNTEVVSALIAADGANLNYLNKYNLPPLFYAIVMNRAKEAKLLIDAGADPDIVIADVAPALHFAILQQNIEIVNALIAAGADLNAKDKDGCTPLKLASNKGYTEIVNTLIDKGANPIDTYRFPEIYYLEYILTKAITWPIDLVKFFTATKSLETNEPIDEQEQNLDTTNINLDETECTGLDGSSAAA